MKHHQPYLHASALGVEDWEREELIALAAKLLNEDIALDMARAASDCGSIGCIGGHMALAHGVSVRGARRYVQSQAQGGAPLSALFFPDFTVNHSHPGWRASATQAARAIINFLTSGAPDWDAVMSASNAERKKSAQMARAD
ncbi:conserved hypothetical protein [Methylocella silvestris BL2]|uniref:Uncharacterized protein n=1 Tax=Methylocella silvestris (strain DSM 15510 / CIP 108128 / LMG 27833 / NCIMB 13906 / BL2) TaxID=395965 RepID=B8EKD4_METSB|nr:hypothetical protein [Methylocella silvestris]ACK50674.1 conserved hypothetical protein [Methylocella silvestris BL2]